MTSNDFGGHDAVEGLTGADRDVHSTATPDEENQVQIDAFLDALADMGMRVAERKLASGGGGEAA